MSLQKIKKFLLRTDLDDIPQDEFSNLIAPAETNEDQIVLVEKYQSQMLKFVKDFKLIFENEKKARLELEKAYFQTIAGLSKAVETRDSYTGGHAERVTRYAILVARELGLPEKEVEEIQLAALLHDIGKISMPDSILSKGAKLSYAEFEIMKTHPRMGAEILKNIHFIQHLVPAVLYHHENFDGTGYPERLSGYDIPLGARIISVVDTFDAIRSSRSYRKGSPPEVAVRELDRCAGNQFDPEIVSAFIRVWKSGKLNSSENQ